MGDEQVTLAVRGNTWQGSSPPRRVVGIGASAGGLRALKSFFSQLRPDSGLAYVVVVHLVPDRESVLAELLQVQSAVPVRQVQDDELLEPNQVYVIPPGWNLLTIDSHLRLCKLEEERRKRVPIDNFFRALADSHRDRAIGVVLSGTGSDGALGLSFIKEKGGLCLCQDPNEADFDGMPQNAIATGMVDVVLKAGEMAQYLFDTSHVVPRVPLPEDGEDASEEVLQLLQKLFARVRSRHGHDFTRYKHSTIMRRIRRRMQIHRLQDLPAYLDLLRSSDEEVKALSEDLLITVTNFFRNAEVFQELERSVVPRMFQDKGPSDCVRAWVVGCSSGEEAYSLTILLLEHAQRLDSPPDIQVFASDIHEKSLMRAREGYYSAAIEADVTPERLERFFQREGDEGYRVRRKVRERVVFAPHNFLRDPPFSRLDLLACRNVLIYLQRDVQLDVLDIFHYALKPDGVLVLGTSEHLDRADSFRPLNKEHSIYSRNNVRPNEWRMPSFPLASSGRTLKQSAPGAGDTASTSYGRLHERFVEQYAPPSLLVNAQQDIVHYSASVSRYLTQPGGEPTNNVFKRVRDEVRIELRAVLYAAQESKKPARTKPILLWADGEQVPVSINVRPILDPEQEGYHLIIFDEDALAAAEAEPANAGRSGSERDLENELDLTRKRLKTVIEQFETSQEEMRASNEELQSTNEELRSTMEELETSKEELQSMNEELTTLNQENKSKVDELSQVTGDLQNLMASMDIATFFLDRNLRILRFTPRITQIFNVRQTDKGRPLTDFTHTLGYMELVDDARSVFDTLAPVEREVQTIADGRWYLLRILPYRSANDRIDGVVITLVDVSTLKKTEGSLRHSEQELREMTENLRQHTDQVRELAARLIMAEQKERSRIARVLHDDLQQLLVSLQIHLQILQEQHELSDQDLGDFEQILNNSIALTRDLAVDMDPPVLRDERLTHSLRWLQTQMKQLHGLEVSIDAAEDFQLSERDLRVMLFQTIRELLFNIVKHAGTLKGRVQVRHREGMLHIKVSDDGVGFDPAIAGTKRSFGLAHLREHVELFRGSMDIDAAEGKGCRVEIHLPYNDAGDSRQS